MSTAPPSTRESLTWSLPRLVCSKMVTGGICCQCWLAQLFPSNPASFSKGICFSTAHFSFATRQRNNECHVLSCSQALSQKYNVAVRKETPVMLPAWVEDVWTVSSTEILTAQDKRFSHHKCLAMQVSQATCNVTMQCPCVRASLSV